MSQKKGYRPPAWADYVIKILGLYNTKARYIKTAAKGDLIKLSYIFEKFKLPFWQLLMREVITVLNILDRNISYKFEWANHRIFGSLKNHKINKRNSTRNLDLTDRNISIFNKECHPFLDSELITIGAFIKNDNTQIKYSELFYSLYGDSITPNDRTCTEVYNLAAKIKKKFITAPYKKLGIDKLFFFLNQNKKHTANIYNLMIKRTFLKDTHPSFENRWLTVFKYGDLISKERIQNKLSEYRINTITQRIGIKSIL